MDHPKPGPKMSCSGSSNVSGENLEEACCGESNFCQNCIKGFPLRNCNKKGNKSFAKTPQGRRAHLTRELCSATTDIKDRTGIGILVLQSCCTAPWPQERAQRNLLQTASVSPFPKGSPARQHLLGSGILLSPGEGLTEHHTRHMVKAFSSASESPQQATAAGARKETKEDHNKVRQI